MFQLSLLVFNLRTHRISSLIKRLINGRLLDSWRIVIQPSP